MKCPSLDITYILSLRPNFFYSEYFTTEGHQRQLFEKKKIGALCKRLKKGLLHDVGLSVFHFYDQ